MNGEWPKNGIDSYTLRVSPTGGPRQMPRSALSNDESKGARSGRLSRKPGACACVAHIPR